MKEINIICEENFGWKYYKNDVSELWYKGIIYNSSFQNLAKNLSDKSQNEIKEFLINLDGNFSFIYVTKKNLCVSRQNFFNTNILFYFWRSSVSFIKYLFVK